MKTLVMMADGFEEIEAITVVDLLRRAGVDVLTVSINDFNAIIGAHGVEVVADTTLDQVMEEGLEIEAILIPGGLEGSQHLAGDERVRGLLKKSQDQGSLAGAICAGPTVLEAAGLLEGKKATCYPGFEGKLSSDQGQGNVVVDGTIITSRGPATAMEFALELVEYLKGGEARGQLEVDLLIR